jgi:hypothetical protein
MTNLRSRIMRICALGINIYPVLFECLSRSSYTLLECDILSARKVIATLSWVSQTDWLIKWRLFLAACVYILSESGRKRGAPGHVCQGQWPPAHFCVFISSLSASARAQSTKVVSCKFNNWQPRWPFNRVYELWFVCNLHSHSLCCCVLSTHKTNQSKVCEQQIQSIQNGTRNLHKLLA